MVAGDPMWTEVVNLLGVLSLRLGDEIEQQWGQWSPAQWIKAFDDAEMEDSVPGELRQAVAEAARLAKPEKPLHESERQTLLRIIKVLADMSSVALTEPHKAAGMMEAHAAQKGMTFPDKTTVGRKLTEARNLDK